MKKNKDNLVYIRHIREQAIKVMKYAQSHSYEYYLEHEWDQAAIMRYLEIIGEASRNIDASFQKKYPNVPWREIIGFRNVLIHDYMDVDPRVVWNIIRNDIPALLTALDTYNLK